MRTKVLVLMGVALGLLLVAGSVLADDKDDAKKIVGTWKFVDGNRGGEAPPAEFKEKFKVTFKDDGKMVANTPNEDKAGTFKLDAGKKPKTIEVTHDNKSIKGIYELDGDNLKICLAEEGEEAPTKFETKQGSKQMLMVFKREK